MSLNYFKKVPKENLKVVAVESDLTGREVRNLCVLTERYVTCVY